MIRRTYHCDDCGENFTVSCNSSDPDPDCPNCSVVMTWTPKGFSIGTNKGKAVDFTQKVMEEDYGMTDFNDRSREGDIAAKMPVETTVQREARELAERNIAATSPALNQDQAKMAAGFFAGTPAAPGAALVETFKAGTKVGPAADVNPMAMLHKAGRENKIPRSFVAMGEKGATVRRF